MTVSAKTNAKEKRIYPILKLCISDAETFSRFTRRTTWWRHQMETFSALLAICAGNSPVPGEFPAQRPVRRSFDVFFDLRLNKRLSKQPWGWWFDAPSWSLWRHCNDLVIRHADNVRKWVSSTSAVSQSEAIVVAEHENTLSNAYEEI